MITLDVIVPTKGRSRALIMQLKLLQRVITFSKSFSCIDVNVLITVNNSKDTFKELVIRYPKFKFHFNNKNLGFDKNVFQGICLGTADYVHILSDNDYRSLAYWTALFEQLESLSIDKNKQSVYPLMFVPVAKELKNAIGTYPSWYAAGISKLCSYAENKEVIRCAEDDHLLSTILQATSQISHVVVQRNIVVQKFIKDLLKADVNDELVRTGLPQSIYLIALMSRNFEQSGQVFFKPFITPCLLAFVPETHRSVWFYDSTFTGQRLLYEVDNPKLKLPSGVKDLSNEIISFLNNVGCNLLIHECAYHNKSNINRWLLPIIKNESQMKRYQISFGRSVVCKLKKTLSFYLKNVPIFWARYTAILVDFKIKSIEKNKA
jgi:hypothetical protein